MINIDSLSAVKKYDLSGMARIISSFPRQCRDAIKIGFSSNIPASFKTKYRDIVCTGMGGSAIGADMVRSYIADEARTPVFVNRNYKLPAFAGRDSLVVVSSYSGNTDETISAFHDAESRRARIIVMTSGGELKNLARQKSIPLILIPSGLQPRAALGYSFFTLATAFIKIGIISDNRKDMDEAIAVLDKLNRFNLGPSVRGKNNIAKSIARSIYSKIPVIYSNVDHLDAVGIRWKGQLAENAKTIASSNLFPEMTHNEIVGWRYPKKALKDHVIIMLRDRDDDARTAKRMDIARKIIAGQGVRVIEVESEGKGLLARIFSLVYIGDYVSFYLAILNKCDPTPVDRIAYLKSEMESSGFRVQGTGYRRR